MNRTLLLTTMAVFIAIGTLGSQFLWFPTGIAKAYPVQHAVNVMAAVTLGPVPAVIIAFTIGLLRNLLGIGTLLAFPGGMIGALFAGYLFRWTRKKVMAGLGEIIGTGVIGALLSVPFAKILMGSSVGALAFLPGFLVSSVTGAIIGLLILSKVKHTTLMHQPASSK
ncbi:energy coupling factor transporter S component ThiW [Gracilibacillus thailandensis]|uniref:Energy coupling factor transporter S component ThiW n=1 Tax=Gracilibacillus thailandensis TaxID=563735 RepID=A0A6N7QVG8_9BACI|nr:energy coupling factor transporter S component ThiW [Gracilibacillus thailandensis]MRI64951.1 energy coupling factor transporter S component ThiW [Gracilibacillus thailandensis]